MLGHHILELPPWRMQWIAMQRPCYPILERNRCKSQGTIIIIYYLLNNGSCVRMQFFNHELKNWLNTLLALALLKSEHHV